jgi:hypothetical protein
MSEPFRPWRRLLSSCLLAILVSGCSIVLGGKDNPRADNPDTTRPNPADGAVEWSSLDWQAVTFEQPPRTSGEQWDQATSVAAGPGGWVAVGSNTDVMAYEGRIWQSTDSLSWDHVDSDLLAGLELVDVAARSDSYVAIGTDSADPNDPTTSILRSVDGVQWAVVHEVRGVWASRVAAGPDGYAVIVEAGETKDLLLSHDGRTWHRVAGSDIGHDVLIADIASEDDGWIVAGSAGDRAVVLRSADGLTWHEEALPASEPVEGVLDVTAYSIIPGRWATLVLGLDRGPSCAEDDDWCDKFQAVWSWTADGGWQRLPESNFLVQAGWGADAHPAGDAGFVYLLGTEVRTSADGWDWIVVEQTAPSDAFQTAVVVTGDRLVAAGIPIDADVLTGWFGTAVVGR